MAGLCTGMLIIIGYGVVIYIVFIKVILQPGSALDNEDYAKKYGPLYEGYKTNHWIYRSFVLFEKIRRLLFVIILVFATDYPIE